MKRFFKWNPENVVTNIMLKLFVLFIILYPCVHIKTYRNASDSDAEYDIGWCF